MRLKGKQIVLGITGGIAAYKAAELARLLMQEGADVRAVMTRSATRFITPLTLRSLTGFPVLTALYQEDLAGAGDADDSGVEHIDIVRTADLVVVAPATANTISKAARGMADDALTTVLLAAGDKILWAPAMNHRMWHNSLVQENLAALVKHGHQLIQPTEGWMACREHGVGRMADPSAIVDKVVECIGQPQDLSDKRILITAGRTEEDIDPVRYISNRSSGRMGIALAAEAASRGADVCLIAGVMSVEPPEGVRVVRVRTAQEMLEASQKQFPHHDALIMAAAVADFRAEASGQKIKREDSGLTLNLMANPDILAALSAERKSGQVLVGFALETSGSLKAAEKKLKAKGVDFLVLNRADEALEGSSTRITILSASGGSEELPPQEKIEAAAEILNRVAAVFSGRKDGHVRSQS